MNKKLTPRKMGDMMLDAVERAGFHPRNVQFGDGYFIFEHGEDRVIHFHIKECRGWKFGIWLNHDDKYNIERFDFFAQYEACIDKFKPSASTFVVEDYNFDEADVVRMIDYSGVLDIIRFIHEHPVRAWQADGYYQQNLWDYPKLGGWNNTKEFLRFRYNMEYKAPKVRAKLGEQHCKLLTDIGNAYLKDFEVLDENHDGWEVSPRYELVSKGGFKDEKRTKKGYYALTLEDEENPEIAREWSDFVDAYRKAKDRYSRYATKDFMDELTIGVMVKGLDKS